MDKYGTLKILGVALLIIFLAYNTYNYIHIEQTTINVGYLPSDHHSALFVASSENMYSKVGLNVNLVPFRSGAELVRALEENQIDIGYCGIAPATIAISKGAPIKIVAPVNTGGSGLVVPLNSSGNISEDLVNKNIAIPSKGSVQDVLLEDLLADNNISNSEVNIMQQDTPLMLASLKNGKINAYLAWEPYVSEAKINNKGEVLLYSNDWWSNHPCCVVVTSDKFIKTHPDELERFLKVHVRATNFIHNNPDEAIQIISSKLGTNENVQKEAFKHLNLTYDVSGNFTSNVLQFMEIEKKLGYINNIPSNESLYDFNFIDDAN